MATLLRPVLAAFLLGAPMLAGGAAVAEPSAEPSAGATQERSAEAEDYEIYERAMDDVAAKGFRGLNRHLTDLRTALDRAPESYPVIQKGPGSWIVRANMPEDVLPLTFAATTMAAREGVSTGVVSQPNVYPLIALILGSHAVEFGRFEEAIGYLDKGLKLQPYNWLLVTEKAAALQGLHRWDDCLALVDEALASQDIVLMRNAGSLHRKRGFALTELGRLDEAEAAYRESLKVEPDNKIALQELDYIRGLKAGAEKAGMQLVAPISKP